jgi:GNAT superfamily N-acetyltransferase
MPHIVIRGFTSSDAEEVTALFAAYMDEMFGAPSRVTPEVLIRDGQGRHFNIILAVDRTGGTIGFAAWRATYDLHNAVAGSEIPDLFVAKSRRGHGVSLRLVAAVARATLERGGTFVKGEVLQDDQRRLRLARRMTVGFTGEHVYLSGEGLRQLAGLANSDIKTIARNLPTPDASRRP